MATAVVSPDNDAVLAEVFIAATPERVFQAITDPKQMPLWWGQQGLYRVTHLNRRPWFAGNWKRAACITCTARGRKKLGQARS
jgi:uncharacterized protein YndB with AHSA1/START domain